MSPPIGSGVIVYSLSGLSARYLVSLFALVCGSFGLRAHLQEANTSRTGLSSSQTDSVRADGDSLLREWRVSLLKSDSTLLGVRVLVYSVVGEVLRGKLAR